MTLVRIGGAERDRTADLLVANEALSQLSYSPTPQIVTTDPFGFCHPVSLAGHDPENQVGTSIERAVSTRFRR